MATPQEIQKVLDKLNSTYKKLGESNPFENYDSSKPEELIVLAHHMLAGYMGEDNADKKLNQILSRFPRLKLRVD